MKLYIPRPLVVLVAVWMLAGCSITPEKAAEMADVPAVTDQPENAYYFYLEAQLKKKNGDLDEAVRYLEQAIALDDPSVALKRELAMLLLEKKDRKGAMAVLEEILAAAPLDVETLRLYGRLNQQMNEPQKAKAAFEKLLSRDPTQENVYVHLGRIYMAEADLDNAFRIFQQMVDHFPASFIGHFYLGQIQAKKGQNRAARQSFEKALMLEPELLEARFEMIELLKGDLPVGEEVIVKEGETLGAICLRVYERNDAAVQQAVLTANPEISDVNDIRAGQRLLLPPKNLIDSGGRAVDKDDQIIGLYQDILSQNPKDPRATIELGLFYHTAGRIQEAQSLLKNLGKRSRTDRVILTTIVQQYFEKKRYAEAKTLLTYMLKGAPGSSELLYVSGLVCSERNEKDQAIAYFKQVKPDSRFFENAVINTTLIYQEQEALDTAIDHLKGAIAQDPDNAEFMLFLGTLYEEKGDWEAAEKILKRAIGIDTDSPKLYFRLGVVYDKWGRKEDCIAAMRTVLRIDPHHANALNYLGYTYADLGQNLDEAEQLIKRALERKPDDGYITDSLGWVYFQKGLYDKAFAFIEKAVRLVPDDPIILEHLGDVYLKMENPAKALEYYRRSLEFRKDDKAEIEKKIREVQEATTQSP